MNDLLTTHLLQSAKTTTISFNLIFTKGDLEEGAVEYLLSAVGAFSEYNDEFVWKNQRYRFG